MFNFKQMLEKNLKEYKSSIPGKRPFKYNINDVEEDLFRELTLNFKEEYKIIPSSHSYITLKNKYLQRDNIKIQIDKSKIFIYRTKPETKEIDNEKDIIVIAKEEFFPENNESIKKAINNSIQKIKSSSIEFRKQAQQKIPQSQKKINSKIINQLISNLKKHSPTRIPNEITEFHDTNDFTFQRIVAGLLDKKYLIHFDWKKREASLIDRSLLNTTSLNAKLGLYIHTTDPGKDLNNYLKKFKLITGEVCATIYGKKPLIDDVNDYFSIGLYGKPTFLFTSDILSNFGPGGRRTKGEGSDNSITEAWISPDDSIIKFLITNNSNFLKQAQDLKIPTFSSFEECYKKFPPL